MASKFTRKALEALGIDAEKVDVLVEWHSDAMKSVMDERDEWKTKYEGLDTTKDWKGMYEDEHKKLNALETANQQKELRASKEAAVRKIYADAGIGEKYITSLLRITDFDKIELDKDGKAKNHDQLVNSAKTEYADFIAQIDVVKGGNTPNPPAGGGKTHMSREDILKINDTAARQKAIAENMDAFGSY